MTLIIFLILFAAAFGYYIAQSKAATISLTQGKKLNSLPMYHGVYVLTLTALPLLLLILYKGLVVSQEPECPCDSYTENTV